MPTGTETDTDLLERCWRFGWEMDEAIAERVEDVGEGITAYIDTRIPLVWDSNFLVAESGSVGAHKVAAKADQVFGELGMSHRAAVARQTGDTDRLAGGLQKLGWDREDEVFHVLRREPDRPASVEVEQVSLDEAWPVNRTAIMTEDWATAVVAEQIKERDRRIGEFYRDRWFVARHEGKVASACRLIQRDGIGQVEDVSTLEPARERGLARAVVLAAAQASVEDGDEITFIIAEANDWPRRLYERLGFDLVGEISWCRHLPR
jgi:ribosomal protein S18 acetylase RimI-like enzyme